MSRAYRPRLSKDKAIAQRVDAEQRLKDLSVTKQITALGVLDATADIDTDVAASIAATFANSQSQGQLSSPPTPSSSTGSSRSSQTSLKSKGSGGSSRAVRRRSSERPAAAAASARTSSSPAGGSVAPSLSSPSGDGAVALDDGKGRGWSCVSCSFLNFETAKKCRMCSTKNYQPSPSAGSIGNGELREPGVQETSLRRQRSTPEPRAKTHTEVADRNSSLDRRRRESGGVRIGGGGGGAGDGPRRGAKTALASELACGRSSRSSDQRKRRKSTGAIAGASAESVGNTSPYSSDTGVAVGAGLLRRKSRRNIDQAAATRLRELAAVEAADGTSNHGPGVLSSRKRSHKRGRVLSPTATSPSTPEGICLPKEPTGVCLQLPFSDGVDLSPNAGGCDEACGSSGPTPTRQLEETREPAALMSIPRATKDTHDRQRQQRQPFVSMLTSDDQGDERSAPRSATSGSYGERFATPIATVTAAAAAAAASVALSNSPPLRAREHSWPTLSRAAGLKFSGGRAWEVSSVIVTTGGRPSGADGETNDSDGVPTVIVCHSGGVSVWGLTQTEAVCTHLSPALAGVKSEHVRGRLSVAVVVGGEKAEVTPSAARAPGHGADFFIVAIGRHGLDLGLPILRVWKGSLEDAGKHLNRDSKTVPAKEKGAPSAKSAPTLLTTTLKKKFSRFCPPAVPRDVSPCLCVCGYSAAPHGKDGDAEGVEESTSREITTVMALGGKALRLVCGAGRNGGPDGVKAKALPTGAVGTEAIFTSLAPVPTNPFLVWAAIPSSNSVLLWNVQELQLLFVLPLTASSICVPAVVLPLTLPIGDGAAAARLASSSRLLCLLATGVAVVGNRDARASASGCGLLGVFRGGDGGDSGPNACSISAVTLEGRDTPFPTGARDADKNRGIGGSDIKPGCLRCLSDGNGFVAGVDTHGRVVARNILTGEHRVLVAADETAGDVGFACIDCDRGAGLLAVAKAGVGCVAASAVDLYTLSDKGFGDAQPEGTAGDN